MQNKDKKPSCVDWDTTQEVVLALVGDGLVQFLSFLLFQIAMVMSSNTCRDSWLNNLTRSEFASFTCAKCLIQLFMNEKDWKMLYPPRPPYWLHHKKISNITVPAGRFIPLSQIVIGYMDRLLDHQPIWLLQPSYSCEKITP